MRQTANVQITICLSTTRLLNQYETYTGGTRQSDGTITGGSWDILRLPSTNTITRLTDLDDTRVIESSNSGDWELDDAEILTPPYLDRDLEHNVITRFTLKNSGPTIDVGEATDVEQHSWRGYQITAQLTTAFAVYTIVDSSYNSQTNTSTVHVSGRDLFDEAQIPANKNAGIWGDGDTFFVYVGENAHAAQNDVLIYDAGLKQWVNSQKLAFEIADRKNADEIITTQLGTLYRELELVTYTYSDAVATGSDSAKETAILENIFKKVTDQSGGLGTNQFIWPAYIERVGGAQEFHIFFNDLTADEIDTIEDHYLADGLGRIALSTSALGYSGVTQTTSYVSTGIEIADNPGNVTSTTSGTSTVFILQVSIPGNVVGTGDNQIAPGDIFAVSSSPAANDDLYIIHSAFYDGSAGVTKLDFFVEEDGQAGNLATTAIYGSTIYKQVIADVAGLFNFQISEFGTQSGTTHFMKLVPDSSWDPSRATELKALAQATTVYLGHTSYSFNPSIETKRDGVTGGPSNRDGVFSNPRLIVSQHSFGGTAVQVTEADPGLEGQGFVNTMTVDGDAHRVFQPKPFMLSQGFILMAEYPTGNLPNREAYRDTKAVFGPINAIYHFDSSDDSWYQGSTKIVGF